MVSARKAWRKLMGLSPGQSLFATPVADSSSDEKKTDPSSIVLVEPVSEHPVPLEGELPTKDDVTPALYEISTPNSTKEQPEQQFSEFKRRKRHRRKQIHDQETCMMRGVYFKNMKWQAAIKVDKKQIHLGTVGTQEEAAHLYDRAAFMCGREPNFELSKEEKQELKQFNWEQFLAMTRSAITKHHRRRLASSRRRSAAASQNSSDVEGEQGAQSSTPSEEGEPGGSTHLSVSDSYII